MQNLAVEDEVETTEEELKAARSDGFQKTFERAEWMSRTMCNPPGLNLRSRKSEQKGIELKWKVTCALMQVQFLNRKLRRFNVLLQ